MKRLLLLIAALPLVYLFVRGGEPKGFDPTVPAAGPPSNLAELEKMAVAEPTAANLLAYGAALINARQPGKSILPLKRALKKDPRNVLVHNNLAVAHTSLRQYGEAVRHARLAVAADPSFQLARNNLDWALSEMAVVERRADSLARIPHDSLRDEALLGLGLDLFMLGRYDESIRAWTVVATRSNSNDALNNIGTAFVMKNQHDDAIVLFRKILSDDPANVLAKNNLAWALEEKRFSEEH